MLPEHQVLIMEDHDIVASAVASIVKDVIPAAQVNKVRTFTHGVKLMREGMKCDLIILDVHLPGGESYQMISTLRAIQPDVRILIYTGNEEQKQALQFLKAGANGFLSKTEPTEEIAVAIRTVMRDRKYMSEDVQQRVADNYFNKVSIPTVFEDSMLSPRETEILDMLLDGKQPKQIASELKLNITTVSTHKGRILSKVGVTNVIDLFKKLKAQN